MGIKPKISLALSFALLAATPFAEARMLVDGRQLGVFERVFNLAAHLLEPAITDRMSATDTVDGDLLIKARISSGSAAANGSADAAFMPFMSFEHFSDDAP